MPLPKFDRNAVFNKVANHLLKQGKPCMKGSDCLYRGPNKTSCAIGCLIEDRFYRKDFEDITVARIRSQQLTDDEQLLKTAIFKSIGEVTDEDISFLSNLQTIHDHASNHSELRKYWLEHLSNFAAAQGLKPDKKLARALAAFKAARTRALKKKTI